MRTERTRPLPLFFTHPIGSLPRPQFVRDLLARREELSADRFGTGGLTPPRSPVLLWLRPKEI